jgi:hypothetical protein
MIAEVQHRSDARLLAYAIMPNHFHLVVLQGIAPLDELMQPLQCRIALLLRRLKKREGHVFERRYRAKPCLNADHLRNAIVYTHNNPVRASLCKDLMEYPWTSHDFYCGFPRERELRRPFVLTATDLFAAEPNASFQQLARNYVQHVEWRQACDDLLASDPTSLRPPQPPARFGDLCWSAYSAHSNPVAADSPADAQIDLRDFVRHAINNISPGLTVELIRTCGNNGQIARIRRTVCERACEAGYYGIGLARHLGVSESYVSRVKSQVLLRRAATIESESCEVA